MLSFKVLYALVGKYYMPYLENYREKFCSIFSSRNLKVLIFPQEIPR